MSTEMIDEWHDRQTEKQQVQWFSCIFLVSYLILQTNLGSNFIPFINRSFHPTKLQVTMVIKRLLGYNVILPYNTRFRAASAHNHSVYSEVIEPCDQVGTLYVTETGAKTYVRLLRRRPNVSDKRRPRRSVSLPQVRSRITAQIHG